MFRVAVHRVAKSRVRLKQLSMHEATHTCMKHSSILQPLCETVQKFLRKLIELPRD